MLKVSMIEPLNESDSTELAYPIGTFHYSEAITPQQRKLWIEELRKLPSELRNTVEGLSDERLETPYRPAGWTVRQVVHHLPDSHMNSYVRFRIALTEDSPSIRAYREAEWAQLSDARFGPIEPSLQILDGLHARWTALLEKLTDDEFGCTFHHPELREVRLDWALGLYAWHSRHHLAHIQNLGRRMNW